MKHKVIYKELSNQVVDYDLAHSLKSKGFNEMCFAYYNEI